MFIAGHTNKDHSAKNFSIIKNNSELMKYIIKEEPTHIICFIAGLVINKVLKISLKFFNIHCEEPPKYPGIVSILMLCEISFTNNMLAYMKCFQR
jgi:hypothetical protein